MVALTSPLKMVRSHDQRPDDRVEPELSLHLPVRVSTCDEALHGPPQSPGDSGIVVGSKASRHGANRSAPTVEADERSSGNFMPTGIHPGRCEVKCEAWNLL